MESNNVKDGQINHNAEIFINDEFYEKQKDKWLHTGDMVMVQSGHVGHAAVIPEELDNTAAHALIMFRNPKEEIEPYFLNYEYQTDKAKKQIENITTGNTIKHILASDMQEFVVDIPKYEEQKVIASYFCNLDNLITLHQRKCEQTKKLKKYMLQKMFPRNGAKVPEIRFDGFTYDWEQRKFSELYARSSEKNDGSIGMDKNITVATMQFKNDVKVSTTEYLKTYYTFKLGDIAFEGHQSKEFRYGRFVENDIGNGIVSHIFAVFRPIQEYDLYFWKYAINNETLMQRILARSTKASTMMHDLVTNDFLNETFLVPSVKEQKQIGAFLNKLDNIITLHQRQTDFYKKPNFYFISS